MGRHCPAKARSGRSRGRRCRRFAQAFAGIWWGLMGRAPLCPVPGGDVGRGGRGDGAAVSADRWGGWGAPHLSARDRVRSGRGLGRARGGGAAVWRRLSGEAARAGPCLAEGRSALPWPVRASSGVVGSGRAGLGGRDRPGSGLVPALAVADRLGRDVLTDVLRVSRVSPAIAGMGRFISARLSHAGISLGHGPRALVKCPGCN